MTGGCEPGEAVREPRGSGVFLWAGENGSAGAKSRKAEKPRSRKAKSQGLRSLEHRGVESEGRTRPEGEAWE